LICLQQVLWQRIGGYAVVVCRQIGIRTLTDPEEGVIDAGNDDPRYRVYTTTTVKLMAKD